MTQFNDFKEAVSNQLDILSNKGLYQAGTTRDGIWETYLGSFAEGTDPIFKERTEHDCVCCKQFIRAIGGAVAFDGNKIITAWDITLPEGSIYQVVADALAAYVRGCGITSEYKHYEKSVGTDKNNSLDEDGKVLTWEHFHHDLNKAYVMPEKDIASHLSDTTSNYDVLYRSLQELTVDSAEMVLELIDQNSLYRGEEHRKIVELFLKKKREFDLIEVQTERLALVWQMAGKLKGASKIRNTVIGTLLADLSEGVSLEVAVKKFEDKVAPHNYKRPTALVTKSMIEKAQKEVVALGYLEALPRRNAVTDDITINNVIFADRSVKKQIDNVFDELLEAVPDKVEKFDKVEEVAIRDFVEKVVPHADSIELLLENRHVSNLMTLVSPVDSDAKGMFKWGNNFSWAYNGGIADSDMRKRVQELGGRVDGVFRFTHSWNHDGNNQSLMDLHVFMPRNGKKANHDGGQTDIYPTSRRVGWNSRSDRSSGGRQDVDFTNPPLDEVPVENITFPSVDKMPEGVYTMKVHNWSSRNHPKSGFKAEIEFGGEVFQYDYPKALKHKEWVTVAEVTLKNGVFTIDHKLPTALQDKEVYGITTNKFHKVNMVMNSPNHWDGEETGNKHHFFILDKCNNPEDTRGFFNEYLNEELTPHRKVMEMLASKMKAKHTDDQLSGLGFSSTQSNDVLVRVTGKVSRVIKVIF